MDAKPDRADGPARLHRVEGEVRREGPAVLLAAEPLPAQHEGAARGDPEVAHLHGVPQQLPLDPGSHGRRILL